MSAHPHAELMKLYAEDASETEKPWERWQCRSNSKFGWSDCVKGNVLWHADYEYRRRPRTITINGIEVPEPMREAPAFNSEYFFPSFMWGIKNVVCRGVWMDRHGDWSVIALGLCHSTKEAAELHAKAMLSFTRKEDA